MTDLDLDELAHDIRALAPGVVSGGLQAERWLTHPAIARRVATAYARAIPAGVERIVASGDAAELLGVAVSLICGLPVAIVTGSGSVLGDRHPGEAVFSIALTDACALEHADGPSLDLVLIGSLGAVPFVFRATPKGLMPGNLITLSSEER